MLIRTSDEPNWRPPSETEYTNEDALERLLAETPSLVTTFPDDPPAIAVRQVPAAGGAVDIVMLGLGGSISIVECKLRRNPEIRRQVVGQLLAYASWFWQMTYDDFAAALGGGIGLTGSIDEAIAAQTGPDATFDRAAFRGRVGGDLAEGRFALVLAVDEITEELRRIVRFLDARTQGDIKVVALELSYVKEGGVEVLVPRTYGAELGDRGRATQPGRRTWDKPAFFAELAGAAGAAEVAVANDLVSWIEERELGPYFGTGARRGDLYARLMGPDGRLRAVFSILTWGRIEIHFEELKFLPPFDDPANRLELARRLNEIEGISIREEQAVEATWPSVALSVLTDDARRASFRDGFDWVVDQVRVVPDASRSSGLGTTEAT